MALKNKKYMEEIIGLNLTGLEDTLTDAKKELFNLRFQNATNQLENTARIREVRKNIARIKTIQTQKQIGLIP